MRNKRADKQTTPENKSCLRPCNYQCHTRSAVEQCTDLISKTEKTTRLGKTAFIGTGETDRGPLLS